MRKLFAIFGTAMLMSLPLACDSDAGDGDAGDDGGMNEVPPTDGDALLSWLEGGNYAGWAKESAPHLSDGPHVVEVKVHMNEALLASLESDQGEHPVESASVKELFNAEGAPSGWAVGVKVTAGLSNSSWYWYEISAGTVIGDGLGDPGCEGCHSVGFRDHVNSNFPLN